MGRKQRLSWSARNAYRRQRRVESPDIPRPLQRRDLSGFRFEYWYSSVDNNGSTRYFRSRTLALRAAKDHHGVMGYADITRIRVITDNGRRGWAIDGAGTAAYVRTHRTRAAEREARIARRRAEGASG